MSSAEISRSDAPVGEHDTDAETSPPPLPYSGPARSGAMTRIDCARPLCAEAATARFLIDASQKLVIVDSKVDEWGASGCVCTKHADRLKAPRGWTLEDRRESTDAVAAVPLRPSSSPAPAVNSPLLSRAFASVAPSSQANGLASLFPASARRSVS